MAGNTHSQLYYHYAWAVRGRAKLIVPELRPRLYAYIWQKSINYGVLPLMIGGVEDHVHLLIRARPNVLPCDAVHAVKGASSHFINQEHLSAARFSWQDGYGVFSVSRRDVRMIAQYLRNQQEHHQSTTTNDDWERTEGDEKETACSVPAYPGEGVVLDCLVDTTPYVRQGINPLPLGRLGDRPGNGESG